VKKPGTVADKTGMLPHSGGGSTAPHAGIDPAVLRAVPLFRDFEDDALLELARLFTVQRYRKHETIFREGDPGETFYIVISGSVAVVRHGEGRRETILSILTDRDFFGEMSVFDTSVRSASIRTLTVAEIASLGRDEFLAQIDRSPRVGRLLVIALAERLRAANGLIAAATSQDIRSRLAALLMNLMDHFGEPGDGGTRIGLRLTNQEMANMIGTTRETVNRALNRFWDEHIIDMSAGTIVIAEPAKLKALLV
jgi:CRP/FNR family cyclic AMP-dependent transcriptional regulator